jgi:hypothetical protein
MQMLYLNELHKRYESFLKSKLSISESRNRHHEHHLAGWSSGNVLDLFSGGTCFESQPGHRLSRPSYFVACLSPSTHFGIVPLVDRGYFHSDPFKLIYQPSYHSTNYRIYTGIIVKHFHKSKTEEF